MTGTLRSTMKQIPPMAKGVDYSFARPSYKELIGMGVTYIYRYLDPGYASGKSLTSGEALSILTNGFGLGLLFERSADRADGGYVAGVEDGARALNAINRLGMNVPLTNPIIACVDVNTQLGTLTTHVAYVKGFHDKVTASGRVIGIYGDTDIINAAHQYSRCNIKAAARSWSPGPSPYVNIVQSVSDPTNRFDPLTTTTQINLWSYEFTMPSYTPSPLLPSAVVIRFTGYANLFLIDSANAIHLSPELRAHYVDTLKVPVVIAAMHAQTFKSVCHKAGITESDLVPG